MGCNQSKPAAQERRDREDCVRLTMHAVRKIEIEIRATSGARAATSAVITRESG